MESNHIDLIYEIKFFEPGNRLNAGIQRISDMTTQEILELAKIQSDCFGRTEMEFLSKEKGGGENVSA